MLKHVCLVLGELQTNCYLLWDENTKECAIIDPADDGAGIAEEIQARNLIPKMVLLTHGHFDHAMAALDLKLIFNIPIACHGADMFLLKRLSETATYFLGKKIEVPNIAKIDIDLDKNLEIELGVEIIRVLKTPGHTPGSVCFYLAKHNLLFSGDTVFYASRGRTDLSYSSTKEIYKSIGKLMELPKEVEVWPGHGPETTIGREEGVYKIKR